MPRALRNSPLLRPGWDKWPRDAAEPYRLGRLGYSYKTGELRADMAPDNTPGRAFGWRAEIWRGHDRGNVLATLGHDSFWTLAVMVMAQCDALREGAA